MSVWRHRGAVAVAGIGTTPYYKRGQASDSIVGLAVRAIVAACDDAGIDPGDVDGFVSYGADRNAAGRLMPSLGTRELRWSTLVWGGGGGGSAGAISVAASAILADLADTVVVYRAVHQGADGRLAEAVKEDHLSPQYEINGINIPIEMMALRTRRMIDGGGVPATAMREFSRAAYFHASNNPAASSRGRLLGSEDYQDSPMLADPYRLYDCSRENDGAAAVIVTSAARARDLRQAPAYVVAAPQASPPGWGERQESRDPYETAGFSAVGRALWTQSGCSPADVDVAQVYENTSGGAVAVMMDLGLTTPQGAGEFFRYDNLIAPDGRLPVNTAGGNLAEGFFHGMGLALEGVRQIRGTSCNQVPGAHLSLVTGGPWAAPASAFLLSDAPAP
ncbi:MAG: thiolase C-terminal domain-containing protein [Desertimonas sp.]